MYGLVYEGHRQYLLIILQLIIQDDAIGLVRLGPGESDAVHGATDLVHYGYSRWSCRTKREKSTF